MERAEKQKELALQAVNILTYNLVDELAQIPRTANIITAILKANVAVLDRIYALEPDTRKAMREKGSNLSRLGNIWLKLGNTAEAVKAYQQDLEISKKLAENDPDSFQAQRDLSVNYNKLGRVQEILHDPKAALESQQQALEAVLKILRPAFPGEIQQAERVTARLNSVKSGLTSLKTSGEIPKSDTSGYF